VFYTEEEGQRNEKEKENGAQDVRCLIFGFSQRLIEVESSKEVALEIFHIFVLHRVI
jgi:hypothetical protein